MQEISNSIGLSTINNPPQYQNQIIHKLNEEMQRLLITLSQLDQENSSLKYQMKVSQSEQTKLQLFANEQVNMNNTLKVQKEARERELKAANEAIASLKKNIAFKDEELTKSTFYIEDCKKKEYEILTLNQQIEAIMREKGTNQSQECTHQGELSSLREFKKHSEDKLSSMQSELYSTSAQKMELQEKISYLDTAKNQLDQKYNYIINSCLKVYLYLEKGPNLVDQEYAKAIHDGGQSHGLISLFNSGDFYKNDYYKIIKEKLDLKLKELYEKLSYIEQQKEQLQNILDNKNQEISSLMSQ